MSTLKSECTNFQEMCDFVAEAHKIIIALDYLDGFTCDMLREEGLWCVWVVPSYIVSILIEFSGLFCHCCAVLAPFSLSLWYQIVYFFGLVHFLILLVHRSLYPHVE